MINKSKTNETKTNRSKPSETDASDTDQYKGNPYYNQFTVTNDEMMRILTTALVDQFLMQVRGAVTLRKEKDNYKVGYLRTELKGAK